MTDDRRPTGGSGSGRAAVFNDDLSDFQPAAPAGRVREIAEQVGFRSREPIPATPTPATSESVTPIAGTLNVGEAPPLGLARRYRTGRNRQLNLKVRAEDAAAFYAIADAQGWVLGETFGHAIAALRRALEEGGKI